MSSLSPIYPGGTGSSNAPVYPDASGSSNAPASSNAPGSSSADDATGINDRLRDHRDLDSDFTATLRATMHSDIVRVNEEIREYNQHNGTHLPLIRESGTGQVDADQMKKVEQELGHLYYDGASEQQKVVLGHLQSAVGGLSDVDWLADKLEATHKDFTVSVGEDYDQKWATDAATDWLPTISEDIDQADAAQR